MQSAVAAQPVPPSIGHGSEAVTTGETIKPAPNIDVVVVVAAATAVAAVVIKARGRRLDFLIVVTAVVVMVQLVVMCYGYDVCTQDRRVSSGLECEEVPLVT